MADRTLNDLFNEKVCDLKDPQLKRYNELRAANAEDLIAAILPPASGAPTDPYDFNEMIRTKIRAAYADGLTIFERGHIWGSFVHYRQIWVCNFLIHLQPKILGYTADVYYPDPKKLANWFQPDAPAPTKPTTNKDA